MEARIADEWSPSVESLAECFPEATTHRHFLHHFLSCIYSRGTYAHLGARPNLDPQPHLYNPPLPPLQTPQKPPHLHEDVEDEVGVDERIDDVDAHLCEVFRLPRRDHSPDVVGDDRPIVLSFSAVAPGALMVPVAGIGLRGRKKTKNGFD